MIKHVNVCCVYDASRQLFQRQLVKSRSLSAVLKGVKHMGRVFVLSLIFCPMV